MNRFFDIASDKVVLEIEVNEISKSYTVEEMEKALGFKGLREVAQEEFLKLKESYTE